MDMNKLKLYLRWPILQSVAWTLTRKRRNFVYDGNKCIFFCANLLGYFPLSQDDQGVIRLRFQSIRLIYAIVFLIFSHGTGYLIAKAVVTNLLTKDISFMHSLRYACFLSTPIVNILPTVALLETWKLAEYFGQWEDFQERYQSISGRKFPLSPSSSCRVISLIALLLTVSLYFIIRVNFLPFYLVNGLDVELHKVFFLISMYSPVCLSCYLIIWIILTGALKDAADLIVKDVESFRWTNRKSLQGHIVLWTQLRELCVGLGHALSYSNFCYCALIFLFGLPYLYIGALAARQGSFNELISSVFSLSLISAVAEAAYRAVEKVGNGFQKKLSLLLSNSKTLGCEAEIISFIQTVSSNPPVISVAGLFNLDRGVNFPLYSSVLTYIIILVQFQGN